jgi:hypothetical protein
VDDPQQGQNLKRELNCILFYYKRNHLITKYVHPKKNQLYEHAAKIHFFDRKTSKLEIIQSKLQI